MNYYSKYLKYKEKYINLKKMIGGDIESEVLKELSDEDIIYLSDDFFKQLKEIYPSCKHDVGKLSNTYDEHHITYGEMEYEGIQTLLNKLNQKFNNFIDLGSGRGKLPLYVANYPDITNSIGVELVKERYEDALIIKDKLYNFNEITDKVKFINDDFININLSNYTNGLTLVWISNFCFSQDLSNRIFKKLIQVLSAGSIICSSKEHNLTTNNLVNIGKLPIKMSWYNESTVYIYKIQK